MAHPNCGGSDGSARAWIAFEPRMKSAFHSGRVLIGATHRVIVANIKLLRKREEVPLLDNRSNPNILLHERLPEV